jgi:hypothetical protein
MAPKGDATGLGRGCEHALAAGGERTVGVARMPGADRRSVEPRGRLSQARANRGMGLFRARPDGRKSGFAARPRIPVERSDRKPARGPECLKGSREKTSRNDTGH